MRSGLRSWQKEALEVYERERGRARQSILWEATPGAGKTTAALHLCREELKSGGAERVIVVVPTTHLKIQWARSATTRGLHLSASFGERQRKLASDYHGIVLSYQQVASRASFFRSMSKNAVVVLDEVHHAADGLSWGDALKTAFGEAKFILCLSGTAFRSDNNAIPFVQYDSLGESQPDYVYSYTHAIQDAVCRPSVFFTYGGEVAWSDGEVQANASFSDSLERVGRTKRLRAALDPDSGWIRPMLEDAHTMLSATRREHPQAGAVLVASSQRHARALARLLYEISKTKPVVVLSDDSGASEKLKKYKDSAEPWLVACNMVSEGVDIPRLRLGVYATTIRTKMYFRQFLGRIVRRTETPHGTQPAFCYLPADPWLRTLAEEIENEQRHLLRSVEEDPFAEQREQEREKPERPESTWQALRSVNSGIDSVIMGGGQLSLWQQDQAPDAELQPLETLPPVNSSEPLSRSEMKAQIAKEIRTMVSDFHRQSGQPHSHIHSLLNRQQKVDSQKECTESQLKERVQLLEQMIASS